MEAKLRAAFTDAADFTIRDLFLAGQRVRLCFVDGLTSDAAIADFVLRPLAALPALDPAALRRRILEGGVCAASVSACPDLKAAISALLDGSCVLLLPEGGAVTAETKSGDRRGPSEPEVESTTRGPKDAFTETLRTNTALLRRHLKTPRLRLYETTAGRVSRTRLALVWVEGAAKPTVVRRMQKRLDTLDTEELLTPSAVETIIPGRRPTPFPLLQATERTDKLASGLTEGRVGLLVDGLPVAYLAPVNLGWLLQSAEDRDTDRHSARLLRVLRTAALLCALLLPGLYVAMACFHQELLPTNLLLAIRESKQSVPFPTALELIGLQISFEVLQEAGLSAPKAVSQPVSIIGGLVVGTAAVEAKLISPAALITVSAAGICGFALPGKSFADAIRLCRLGLTVLAAFAGLYGLTLGFLALVLHLACLDSFGKAYLAPVSDLGEDS